MKVEKAIDGIEVVTSPVSSAAWRIEIKNTTADSSFVVWDESSFVGSSGAAHGRLVRGATKVIDAAKAQPPSPLPPNAAVIEFVVPEDFADELNVEKERPFETDEVLDHRAKVLHELNGGHLYVVVQTPTGKQTWSGVITEQGRAKASSDDPAPPPETDPSDDPAKTSLYWCSPADGRCSADQARCKDHCTPSKAVWCAAHSADDGNAFDCATSRDSCLRILQRARYSSGECIPRTAGGR